MTGRESSSELDSFVDIFQQVLVGFRNSSYTNYNIHPQKEYRKSEIHDACFTDENGDYIENTEFAHIEDK